jgi:hypothetical protein
MIPPHNPRSLLRDPLLRALLPLSLLLALPAQRALAGAIPGSTASEAAASSSFAIADFDGDRIPDLATVNFDCSDASSARYSIRFTMAAGPSQTIGLTAPFGGLLLSARDVNGDNALDLIVTTPALRQPVAILLNDGHGQFTMANPAAFSSAIWDSSSGWQPASTPTQLAAALPPRRSSSGRCAQASIRASIEIVTELLPSFRTRHISNVQQFSLNGRAPPVFLPSRLVP